MAGLEALARLETIVIEEREAIRRLDSGAVLRAAEEKEALMAELADGVLAKEPAAKERVRALVDGLRHNGVMLAHARDMLRDAIEAAHGVGAATSTFSSTPGRTTARPGLRLSVTG